MNRVGVLAPRSPVTRDAMEKEDRGQELTRSGSTLGFSETLAVVESVKACAKSLGIRLHPASRISRFEQQMNRFGSIKISEISQTDFDWNTFTEGNRDLTEIAFICDKLRGLFPETIGEALKPLFDGSSLPSSDSKTFARDKQFELYVAALFAHSGFNISLDEPDLRFEHDRIWYGIAAKRVTSASQIRKRVREAISQLERSRLRGLVALSVDRLLGIDIPRVVASSEKALDDAGATLVTKVLKEHGPAIAQLLLRPSAVGLIINLVVPAMIARTPGHIGTTTSLRMMPRPDDQGTVALTQSINKRLKSPY